MGLAFWLFILFYFFVCFFFFFLRSCWSDSWRHVVVDMWECKPQLIVGTVWIRMLWWIQCGEQRCTSYSVCYLNTTPVCVTWDNRRVLRIKPAPRRTSCWTCPWWDSRSEALNWSTPSGSTDKVHFLLISQVAPVRFGVTTCASKNSL